MTQKSGTLKSVREERLKLFLGEFGHSIDNKNRLRIPPKFRKEMQNTMILTKGNDGCLFLMPKEQFDKILIKFETVPMFDNSAQRPLRFLLSSAIEIEEDNQGRFLLPLNLKNFANILKEVVFIGVGNRIEIWSKENWEQYNAQNTSNFDDIVGGLKEYGI